MKILLKSEADFVRALDDMIYSIGNPNSSFRNLEDLEDFMGVELLDNSGKTLEENDDWELSSPLQFKRTENSNAPEKYPCVMHSLLDTGELRSGSSLIVRAVQYTYLDDFNLSS